MCTHLQFSHQGLQDTKEFAGVRVCDRLAIQSHFESIEQLVEGWGVDYRPWEDIDVPTMERGHKICCTLFLYDPLKLGLEPTRKSACTSLVLWDLLFHNLPHIRVDDILF